MSIAERLAAEERSTQQSISVDLSAVIVTVDDEQPKVLAIRTDKADALPSGPLEPRHRTLEAGLRAWVETQTRQTLGYVEQLYTFGDSGRSAATGANTRSLSIGYLALVPEAQPPGTPDAEWRNWYRYFPWEDWRNGRPPILDEIAAGLKAWVAQAEDASQRRLREARVRRTFGNRNRPWNEEPVLDRYELLYEAGLVPEAHRDGRKTSGKPISAGEPMFADHRRILATAITRLRGKIKYRPVVFELMPEMFPLLHLQRTVEALAGVRLHKPNFRRLVEGQGLVEDTGAYTTETGGRPARLVRFRSEALLEGMTGGIRLPVVRS
nr:MAG: hypothetical protein DIU74_08205 [Pseudomonadota bacterium]